MILIAALTAVLFMGGWLSPFWGSWLTALSSIPVIGWVFDHGIHWFLGKTAFFLFCFLWFRATFPRYRYDQIMRLGWKVFLPITFFWLFVEGIAIAAGWQPWLVS